MFDVGWQELALTGVVALLVLGPKELPGMMRTAGKLVRKARLIAHDFRMNLEDLADEAELDDFRRTALVKAGIDPDKPLPAVLTSPDPDSPEEVSHDKPAAS